MHIGKKIKKLREDRGLKQVELATKSKISCSFLNDIEKERSNPSFEKLQQLCSILQVDINTIFAHESNEDNHSPVFNEIYSLIKDVENWNLEDQQELLNYLKVKAMVRK